jgi:hypothetical protein
MVRRDKGQKSARLLELEDVFERRTRRFSPFAVLGLKPEADPHMSADAVPTDSSLEETGDDSSERPVGRPDKPTPPTGEIDPPGYGSGRPIPDTGTPIPGMGKPTKVVVSSNITTTGQNRSRPGMGVPMPVGGGSDPPMGQPSRPTPASINDDLQIVNLEKHQQKNSVERPQPSTTQVADLIVAAQLGGQIGNKARQVLKYLNNLRSLEHKSYTVPVGYGQISSVASVDPDYLRRKVIPKLAMLGLIGIARRSLDGTVYHLPHNPEYIQAVIGNYSETVKPSMVSREDESTKDFESSFVWPEWIDRQKWGWLSQETIDRLIQKAGSDAHAREKLDIIIYNETHGAPQQRVRNRRSVLAHYLASPQAEIWPNDEGFETMTMRQVRLDKERAQQEKAMAEEALRTRQEAEKVRFVASLLEGQRRWITQEAKRLVDHRPDSKFLSSRYPLYKAEEERLLEEWIERTKFGESIPDAADSE